MSNTLKLLSAPAYIGGSAGNVYTPGGGSALLFDIIRHIHVANDTGSAATFSLCVGATGVCAGGTEIVNTYSVAAHGIWDWYGAIKLLGATAGNYLTAICQTGASTLTIMVEGETGAV